MPELTVISREDNDQHTFEFPEEYEGWQYEPDPGITRGAPVWVDPDDPEDTYVEITRSGKRSFAVRYYRDGEQKESLPSPLDADKAVEKAKELMYRHPVQI